MTQPPPGYYTPVPSPPGRTLGLIGLILAIVAPLVGLVVSIVARSQSQQAGLPNPMARAGIIVSVVLLVLGTVLLVAAGLGGFALFKGIFDMCQQLGPGVHQVNGVTYTCS
jgi:uncharacterized membrane protein